MYMYTTTKRDFYLYTLLNERLLLKIIFDSSLAGHTHLQKKKSVMFSWTGMVCKTNLTTICTNDYVENNPVRKNQ